MVPVSIPGMSASPPADSSFDIWRLIGTFSSTAEVGGVSRGSKITHLAQTNPPYITPLLRWVVPPISGQAVHRRSICQTWAAQVIKNRIDRLCADGLKETSSCALCNTL